MKPISFEEGLSTLFRLDLGENILGHLSLAERTGFSQHAQDWLRQRLDHEPGKTVHFGWFGRKSLDQIVAFWEVLREGDPREIRNSVRALVRDEQDSTILSLALNSIIPPLVVLGRGSSIGALHDQSPQTFDGRFAESAALDLGACGDWDNALAILERAHQGGASPQINMSSQSLLWKHAYLQGHVETVLPRLAAIPFNRELAHAAASRAWQLAAYRIRAGGNDAHVPAVAPEEQIPSYVDAAAIQMAALEGIPSAARERVDELRRALVPRTLTIQHADRGMSFELDPLSDALFTAQVRIAAQRGDYDKLSSLARTQFGSLVPASAIVIDALIEEGDWRGAAEIADRHDPRDQAVIEGFDDTRMNEYCELQLILAAAAARSSNDAAARAFLSRHVDALTAMREADRSDTDEGEAGDSDRMTLGLWPAALLAGAAEGVVPRRILAVLLPVFRNAY
jgi:hypothetical protein